MTDEHIIIQKINLAIKINKEFLEKGEGLRWERVAFLEGRIEAYEHVREMFEELKGETNIVDFYSKDIP